MDMLDNDFEKVLLNIKITDVILELEEEEMPKKIFDKQYILENAVILAKEVGLEKMSMRNLAKRMKCSVTPIYDSYESKEDLIEAVFKKVIEENNSSKDYFVRNREILLYGIKYPLLYREIRKQSAKSQQTEKYYNEVIKLMSKQKRLKGFNDRELESLNFDILIYMNGLVERSIAETELYQNIEQTFLTYLEQVTELFILGYRTAKTTDKKTMP